MSDQSRARYRGSQGNSCSSYASRNFNENCDSLQLEALTKRIEQELKKELQAIDWQYLSQDTAQNALTYFLEMLGLCLQSICLIANPLKKKIVILE